MRKRAVITIHGIRTRGEWQKMLAPVLAAHDLIPYPLDYGKFSALRLVLPWSRESQINWFHREYDRVCNEAGIKRPSIIAHSFGTYLTCQLMHRYPHVKFDKMLLAGAIISETFDWPAVIDRGQVLHVINEVATKDKWPRVAKWVVREAGLAGSKGFTLDGKHLIQQRCYPIGHSGTFFTGQYRDWCQFLSDPLLFSKEDLKTIQWLLDFAADRVANRLQVPGNKVRSSLFIFVDGKLRIPTGAHYNMNHPGEVNLTIPVGMGSAGLAYQKRKIHIAVRIGKLWDEAGLPDQEFHKLHPDLAWIISVPLINPETGGIIGVMGVDGLTDAPLLRPPLQPSTESVIKELETTHAEVMVNTLCGIETGGF